MRSRVALALVRLYPRQWRERYAFEMRDLLEAPPPTWGTLIDLTRGCASEWVRDSGPARFVGELLASFAAILVVTIPAAIAAPYVRLIIQESSMNMVISFGMGFGYLARQSSAAWRYAVRHNLNWRAGRPLPPYRLSRRETMWWRVVLIVATVLTPAPTATSLSARSHLSAR